MYRTNRSLDGPIDLQRSRRKLRTAFFFAAMSFTLLLATSTKAQVPILYYDFENNTTRTTFENLVEQVVNSGSAAITRAGNTTTINAVAGAGTFNGGAAAGQAATGSNWDNSAADPGSTATNFYQFVVNTAGFSQISISLDNQASGSGPARFGVLYSTDGTNFTALTTAPTGNAAFSALTFDLSIISAIDNQPSVTVRLYAFAGSASDRTGRSAFASGGTFRIDNLAVLAKTVAASKTLLDYPAIGLSLKSGTAFTPTYADFTVNGAGIAVTLVSELRVSGTLSVSSGALDCGTNIVSGTGAFTLASGATLGIGSSSGITSSGATGNIQTTIRTFAAGANYNYNGGSAQNTGDGLPSTVNDLNISNGAGVSLGSDITVDGVLELTTGTFSLGAHTLTLINPIGGPATNLTADATSSITIAGAVSGINIPGSITALNNLTLNNPNGTTLQGDLTVVGTLGLTSGDITTGSRTLFMGNGSMSTGNGDVVGNVNRGDLGGATTRTFGNPNVQITITEGTVTGMTVNLMKASPADFGNSVRRIYSFNDVAGSLIAATVRLHYLDSELNGNSEVSLELWRKDGSSWVSQGATTRDATDNWVEKTLVADFSQWTISGPAGPTFIAMVGYSAKHGRDGKLRFQWETGEEVDNLGFNIYRDEGGHRTRINKSLILGSGLTVKPGTVMSAGRSYLWQTSQALRNDSVYWIEEIDLNGTSVWHGPVSSRSEEEMTLLSALEQTIADRTVTLEDLATEGAQGGVTLPMQPVREPFRVTPEKTSRQHELASQDAVKITVKQEGWYRIGKAQLVAAGLNPKADPRSLQLYADGVEMPITITPDPLIFDSNSAIEFYAVGLDTPSTDQRLFWLISAKTPGKRIAIAPGDGMAPSANSFLSTVERRDRVLYLSGVHNGDAENFFGAPVGSLPVDQIVMLQDVETTSPGPATVEVAMQGFSLTPHSVSVSLNGSPLGTLHYEGASPGVAQFTVPNNLLADGQNVFTLAGQPRAVDVSAVDHIRVRYWRKYTADVNALEFSAQGNQQVRISGFTRADVRVVDITDPRDPSMVAATVEQRDSRYSVTVGVPATGDRTMFAFAGDQVRSPFKLEANQVSTWRTATNQADLIIITHPSLKDNFAPLAALRKSQGLKVETIDVEDIYDEFNFGNKSPRALKDFLSYAHTNWNKAPRYVLLAGSASYDPKNYNGFGIHDLVPTKLIDTDLTETASDDWFADFDLDGVAELAIGRLPVHTSQEASSLTEKLISYETSAPQDSALLVSDDNLGFDFEGANAQLATLFPGAIAIQKINRGQSGTGSARQQLMDGIARGQKIVNYVGHGSPSGWRGSLLTTADALALNNSGRYPLFVLMTCLNGEFQHPQLNPLATGLMTAQQGGAIAVWASSGLTRPPPQAILNQQFYNLLFQLDRHSRGPRLGDATIRAKAAISDADVRRTWILFGDPSMRLK
jgi:peptidase C25-like protein